MRTIWDLALSHKRNSRSVAFPIPRLFPSADFEFPTSSTTSDAVTSPALNKEKSVVNELSGLPLDSVEHASHTTYPQGRD